MRKSSIFNSIRNPYGSNNRVEEPEAKINQRLTVAQLRRVQNLIAADPEAGLKLYAKLCEQARG
jgi:hypothetical protein